MDTIYNLLKINKRISLAAYNRLCKLKGLWCRIEEPIQDSNPSIFGLEDVAIYDKSTSYKKKLLIIGLFQEGSQGMQDFDTFVEGVYILTPYKFRLPLQTQVEVNFCNRKMTFKVDDHRNLMPDICEQFFIKNILVPAT